MNGCCDGCSAPSVASIYLADGRLLELCGNHGRRHQSVLLDRGALIIGDLRFDRSPAAQPLTPGAVLDRVALPQASEPEPLRPRGPWARLRVVWSWFVHYGGHQRTPDCRPYTG